MSESTSEFNGGLLGMIGTLILVFIINSITIGLGLPWTVCIWQRWLAKHTILDGQQITFDGTGMQLFGNYIKWWLLCIVTLGIYGFWVSIKFRQWVTKHTHLDDGMMTAAEFFKS